LDIAGGFRHLIEIEPEDLINADRNQPPFTG
jgi:hypothetical protein